MSAAITASCQLFLMLQRLRRAPLGLDCHSKPHNHRIAELFFERPLPGSLNHGHDRPLRVASRLAAPHPVDSFVGASGYFVQRRWIVWLALLDSWLVFSNNF